MAVAEHVQPVGFTVDAGNDEFVSVQSLVNDWSLLSMFVITACVGVLAAVRLVPEGTELGSSVLDGLRNWLEATEVPAAITDRNGRLIISNDQLVKILPEVLIAEERGGINFVDLLTEVSAKQSHSSPQNLRKALNDCSKSPIPQSLQLSCNDGRRLTIHVAAQIDESASPNLIVWSVLDSVQHQKLQLHDKHSEKMEAITRLAGGMAHEFNNLLTAILGNIELIRSRPDVSVTHVVGNLESAEVAALRASQLIGELRRFGSREVPPSQVSSVVSIVKKVRRILSGMVARNIDVSHSFENDGRLFARINPGQLEEALLKLGVNSAEAIGPENDGRINLSVSTRTCDEHELGLLEIVISDSGPGMDTTTRERAFEPFFTTKYNEKAFGLGMAIAYGLIEEMGGTINIADSSEAGSCVSICFPLEPNPDNDLPPDNDSSINEAPVQLRIAMVDNELSIRNVANGMLKLLGHKVALFSDGTHFLNSIKSGQKFDLVLMDSVMPGMTGRTTFGKLRELDVDLPVIICSGRSLDLQTFCPDGGSPPEAFLGKPFSISDLSKAIAPYGRKS